MMAITPNAANKMPMPNAARATECRDDIEVTLKCYHMRGNAAAGQLRFFSGALRGIIVANQPPRSRSARVTSDPPTDGFAVANF